MRNIVGSDSIVQMRGWHKIWHQNQLLWYRTYQEWCKLQITSTKTKTELPADDEFVGT